MNDKISLWVWHCDAQPGSYLFHGNPNHGMPSFHLGSLENMIWGEWLVWERTRHALEMDLSVAEWNHHPRTKRVRPKLITIELYPADAATRSRRKRKEGREK